MTYLKRIPLAVAVVAALALAVVGLTACGSSSAPSAGVSQPGASQPDVSQPGASRTGASQASASGVADTVSATCELVSAVLSDGPDPDADPVGYAEAQVGPLRGIKTGDAKLRDEIGKLADAYQELFTTNGTKTAKEAVSVASSAISKICPGATS
jgi:hypothetical protein